MTDERLIAEARRPMTDLDITQDPAATKAFIRRLADALEAATKPQGEPSDAQVRAALRVFFDGNPDYISDPESIADMRAALRAAGGAR